MVTLLFGEVETGRVGRLDFAKGVGLAVLGFALTLVAFELIVRGAEWFARGGPPSWLAMLGQFFGFALAGIGLTVVAGFVYAFFNVLAKRARDLGFTGWKALTVATMLGTAFSLAAPLLATGIYVALVWALLLGLPSQPHRRRASLENS